MSRSPRHILPWLIAVVAFTVATGCIPSCNIAHVRPEQPRRVRPEPELRKARFSSQLPAQQLVPERWWIDGAPRALPAPALVPQPDLFLWDAPWVLPTDADVKSPERQPLLAPMPFAEPKP